MVDTNIFIEIIIISLILDWIHTSPYTIFRLECTDLIRGASAPFNALKHISLPEFHSCHNEKNITLKWHDYTSASPSEIINYNSLNLTLPLRHLDFHGRWYNRKGSTPWNSLSMLSIMRKLKRKQQGLSNVHPGLCYNFCVNKRRTLPVIVSPFSDECAEKRTLSPCDCTHLKLCRAERICQAKTV